jgi:hypothetical protein
MPGASVTARTIQGLVQGDHNTVTLNYTVAGAVAGAAPPAADPTPAPPPVVVVPPPFDLVGRADVCSQLGAAVASGAPGELVGPAGAGKTAVLRNLCARPELRPGGNAVYLDQRRRPLEDLLQFLVEVFYDTPPGVVVSPGRRARLLQAVRALIVVDDVTLDRDDLGGLRSALPACCFLVAGADARLGEGHSFYLRGLPSDDCVALLSRLLERSLSPDEAEAGRRLAESVAGLPLAIVQAAGLVRQGDTLSHLAAESVAAAAASVSGAEAAVVAAVAAGRGVPVDAGAVAQVTGVGDADRVIEGLVQRGVLVAHSPTYTVAGNLEAPTAAPDVATAARLVAGADRLELAVPLIDQAAGERRWADALEIARAAEPAAFAAARWGAWREVLEHALEAGRQLGDERTEGWALHQLGTRSLALGEYSAARSLLRRALAVRREAGDADGVAVTENNLRLLDVLAVPPSSSGGGGGLGAHLGTWLAILGAVAAVVTVGVVAGRAMGLLPSGSLTPSPLPTATPSATPPAALHLRGVSPATAGAGGSRLTVTVSGDGIGAQPTVSFGNGITIDSLKATGGEIVAVVTLQPDAAPGRRDVTVTSGGLAATCAGCFTVTARPLVESIAAVGQRALNHADPLQATGFVAGTTLATTVRGVTMGPPQPIIAATPARSTPAAVAYNYVTSVTVDASVAPGRYDVVARNPDGGTSTCSGCLVVDPPPAIDAKRTSLVLQRGSTAPIQVYGQGISGGASLLVAGAGLTPAAQALALGDGYWRGTVTASGSAALGPQAITVVNPDGGTDVCGTCLSVIAPIT